MIPSDIKQQQYEIAPSFFKGIRKIRAKKGSILQSNTACDKLDERATSKDTSNPIFAAADLLREAGNLPLLILCRASPGAFTICTLPSMNETP